MTLLTVCQNAAFEIGSKKPTQIIDSSGQFEQEILQFVYRAGADVRSKILWPQLRKLHTFTVSDGVASYAMPGDFDQHIHDTQWDRSNEWPLLGPLTPQEWRARKEGINTTSPRFRFSVYGYGTNQFFLDPTPGADEDGQTLVFEYQSDTWILPRIWASGTDYSAGDYVSYNGNVYSTATGGTAGSTAPTHTSGSASDGGITWDYQSDPYTDFLADTDFMVLPEKMIELGAAYKFLRANGFPYEHLFREYDDYTHNISGKLSGARKLNLASGTIRRKFIGPENVPDTGFGN